MSHALAMVREESGECPRSISIIMMEPATPWSQTDDVAGEPVVVETPAARCAACEAGVVDAVFGMDPDGLVICRVCGTPLFYCDVGGSG